MGGAHLSGSEHLLAFVAGVRVGAGRRERVGRVECILDCAGSANGRDINASSVVAISTSAVSSPISR
jgi:hypothetical protein